MTENVKVTDSTRLIAGTRHSPKPQQLLIPYY